MIEIEEKKEEILFSFRRVLFDDCEEAKSSNMCAYVFFCGDAASTHLLKKDKQVGFRIKVIEKNFEHTMKITFFLVFCRLLIHSFESVAVLSIGWKMGGT